MPRNESESLLSVAQAAMLLGVHPNTIRSWTDAGRLNAFRINARGDRRFRRDDVARLLVEDGPDDAARRSVPQHPGEVAAFGRISAGIAASPTPDSAARLVVEALRTDLAADRAAVYVVDGRHLKLAAHGGFDDSPPAQRPMPADDAGSPPVAAHTVEMRLTTRRGLIGLLVIDAGSAGRLSDRFTRSFLTTAGTMIGIAGLLERARRELHRARALRMVTKELAGQLDLTKVLDDIVERTSTLFDADRAGLWMFDQTPHPVALVSRGLSDRFLAAGAELTTGSETIALRALRRKRVEWMRNADRDPAIGEMQSAYVAEGIRTVCIVPLLLGGRAIGVIGLYHDADRTWPEEEVTLVQAFADQAAVGIQNARLYRSVADQAARMRSIQDLSARLNRLTDVRAIAEAIVAEARTLADYHDIRIYRVDRERGMCDPIAFTHEMLSGDPADAEAQLRVRIGEGFTGWVAEHGEPLLINDAVDDGRGKTIDGTEDVPESMLVVPMLYEGQALGVIVLSQLGYGRFTTDDLQTMSIFGGYAAQAMANATTYEQLVSQSTELARRADSQRRLLEVSERLLSTLDQADVLEIIADGLRDVVAYDNLSIYRADSGARVMLPVLTRERHAEQVGSYIIPFGRGLMGWAVEHGQPILANDALADPRALQIPGTPEDPEAVVVVPLIAEGEVLGALNVSRVGGPEIHFSATDFELVQLFAAQASIALSNADVHHAVSERAETDALTGLGNHGAFQRDLGAMVEEAAGGRLTMLMMDLDCFKAYNDQHGHPSGDALLHRVATAIYGAARSDDRVYRYGGDEFALILPDTTVAAGARVAQRIRRAVAALTRDEAAPVTITIGVAGLPGDASDRASLLGVADTALYYGKRAGEDRVVRADRLPADVGDLRGTLVGLASAALRENDDAHAAEHLVERASQLSPPQHDERDSLRDALLSISRSFDARGASHHGHTDRVGRLGATLAAALALDADAQHDIELAARLHVLDDHALAEMSAIASLRDVSALVVGYHHLRANGQQRTRRAARAQGGIGSHIVAVANAYDEMISGVGEARVGRADALVRLRRDFATYRSDVLEALAATVNQRRDPGRRRRTSDVADGEARGAA